MRGISPHHFRQRPTHPPRTQRHSNFVFFHLIRLSFYSNFLHHELVSNHVHVQLISLLPTQKLKLAGWDCNNMRPMGSPELHNIDTGYILNIYLLSCWKVYFGVDGV